MNQTYALQPDVAYLSAAVTAIERWAASGLAIAERSGGEERHQTLLNTTLTLVCNP